MKTSKQIQKQSFSSLIIYFYLTKVKREEIGPLIQFLQKFNLNFRRIKNEKQLYASNFLCKNSNFLAESAQPISFHDFQMLSQFLNTKTIVVGYDYGKVIWNVSRIKNEFVAPVTLMPTNINDKNSHKKESTLDFFSGILF